MMFGLALVLMMLLRPEGIFPSAQRKAELRRRAVARRASRRDGRAASVRRRRSAQSILEARKVTKRFGGLVAVSEVDFTIEERSIVSLIGPNGAGKTTFFNMIAGLYTPTAGEITFQRAAARPASRRTRSPGSGSRGRSRTSACSPR